MQAALSCTTHACTTTINIGESTNTNTVYFTIHKWIGKAELLLSSKYQVIRNSNNGATILHPKCVEPALHTNILNVVMWNTVPVIFTVKNPVK